MLEQDLTVEREDGPRGGRYVIRLSPGYEAEMTYHRVGPDTIAIDHTGVPTEFRGQNIALQLVKQAIADARSEGFKIMPLCSYVAVQFRRHPDWAPLLAS